MAWCNEQERTPRVAAVGFLVQDTGARRERGVGTNGVKAEMNWGMVLA